jgi:hypothetical protein
MSPKDSIQIINSIPLCLGTREAVHGYGYIPTFKMTQVTNKKEEGKKDPKKPQEPELVRIQLDQLQMHSL